MDDPQEVPGSRTGRQRSVRVVERVGNLVAGASALAAAAALLTIIAICSINVFRRYIFGAAWSWAEEAMVYLMIFIVFAGAVTVTWRNAHMRIDLVLDRLAPRVRSTAIVLYSVLAIGVLSTLSYFSFQVVSMLYSFDQKTDALEMPMWIPQSLIAIGFALFAILIPMRIYVHGTKRGITELDEVARDRL